MSRFGVCVFIAFTIGCAARTPAPARIPGSSRQASIALPGVSGGPVMMDYLAYDRSHRRVWVPAGGTGAVFVIEAQSHHVSRLDGFATREIERDGRKRTVGPSSATVGDGVVYVGNRGDSSVCAFDAASLERRSCVTLDSMPDGLAFVASKREVWVTAPRSNMIVILDAGQSGALSVKGQIQLPGQPEGFAVDDARGVFYTNLEDRDQTLTIDLSARTVTKRWTPHCGEDGPKGVAIARGPNLLLVACKDRVLLVDVKQDGRVLSTLDAGDGIDNIEYVQDRRELFVAAARAGKLTIARLADPPSLKPVVVSATAAGARNAVATENGDAFLTNAPAGTVLWVEP
jgi:DNA-binding beta-propeller fold protein YncE